MTSTDSMASNTTGDVDTTTVDTANTPLLDLALGKNGTDCYNGKISLPFTLPEPDKYGCHLFFGGIALLIILLIVIIIVCIVKCCKKKDSEIV